MELEKLQKLKNYLELAQGRNASEQSIVPVDSYPWHGYETVDDHLHDALAIVETLIEEATPE